MSLDPRLLAVARQSVNFGVLTSIEPLLGLYGAGAESSAYSDPNGALIKCRQFGEVLVEQLLRRTSTRVESTRQIDRIRALEDAGVLTERTADALHQVRKAGNDATHSHLFNVRVTVDTLARCFELGMLLHRAVSGDRTVRTFVPPRPPEPTPAAGGILLECDPAELEFADGHVRSTTDHTISLSFSEVTEAVYRRALAAPGLDQPLLEATRVELPHNFHHLPDDKGRFSAYPSFPYSAHVVLLEVDVETGVVRVLEYSAVDDCGVVISPTFVAGQLYGAIAQGIGGALWEELPYDAMTGRPTAQTFKQYLTPRAPDLPSFRLQHHHTPSPFTLLGTKGAGESGVGGAMAAITNGVNDALLPLGVHAHRLPLSPPNVLAATLEGTGR